MTRKFIGGSTTTVLLLLGVISLLSSLHAQDKSSRNTWTWNNSDDGKKIEVRVENKVEFNDDYSDVASIPGDGELRIYDSRGANTFKLVVSAAPNGGLRRDYWVDGQVRPFDADARAWLRGVLLQAAREGGLDAKNRVERILKQRGTRGLIDEITYVKGDYVRRIYFEALLQSPGVSTQDLKAALRNASTSIRSDYERAQLLVQIAKPFLANRELVADYFEAVNRIGSDYEHGRVLAEVFNRNGPGKEILTELAKSAAGIKSDYEKASFLIKAAESYQGDAGLRREWLNAVRTIGSDYEHHRTLTGALKPNEISTEALTDLVTSAARMQSDYEKASFLIEALKHYRNDPRLRSAFVETAKTIGSEYERGRVQKQFDRADF